MALNVKIIDQNSAYSYIQRIFIIKLNLWYMGVSVEDIEFLDESFHASMKFTIESLV